MYKQISISLGLNYVAVPLSADSFELDLPAMLAAINEHQPSVIFIAYPNNPTGNLFDESAIKTILESANGLVVIDEAYAPFANASFMDKLADYPNLLVMRTVSKLGLAGLRLGYLVGDSGIIEQLNKVRLPYNINCLTQLSVQFALSHHEVFDQQTAAISAERTRVLNALNTLDGIKAYPSAANFILFRTPIEQAEQLFLSIKTQGVLIKNLNQGGLLQDCLRVTVGTTDENTAFLTALANALEQLFA
jgi:histidinol-phosphate aminotransferase